MSRSRRKPYITEQQSSKTVKQDKRHANRIIRNSALDDISSGKAYRKYSNSWDIRDWYYYDPNNKKAYRK